MALPSSGAISLSQVNVELSRSASAQISLGESAVRTLFGVASGAISMSNGYGKSNAYAPINTALPTISGTTQVGSTLSSTTGTWTGTPTPTYSYQWQRNGSNIGGATGSTYTLVPADDGKNVRCVVTATNSVGSVAANSNATAAVSPPAFGSSYGGGYYTGKIVQSGSTYYVIVAPKSTGESNLKWATYSNNGLMTAARTFNDGPTASASMNNATYFPAAYFCENLTINGYTDWYMPARDELELCYRNLRPSANEYNNTDPRVKIAIDYPEGNDVDGNKMGINRNSSPTGAAYTDSNPGVTSVAAFAAYGSGPEAFALVSYASSTYAGYDGSFYCIWQQNFNVGNQTGYGYACQPTFNRYVRAVRRIAM